MRQSGFENDLIYALVPTIEITQSMINCIRASINIKDQLGLRTNLDGSITIVKFNSLSGNPFASYVWLSLNEILPLLQDPEWFDPRIK